MSKKDRSSRKAPGRAGRDLEKSKEQRGKTAPAAGPRRGVLASAFQANAVWLSLAITVGTVVAYAGVWNHEFVAWDDPAYITQNPDVLQGLTAHGVRWAFASAQVANWHPVTWLSHMLDVQMFGANAGMHHAVNLVLHILTAILLFGVLGRMTGAIGRSAFVAALFALHPLHVESVAWASERKDVLSTLFLMLALGAGMKMDAICDMFGDS